jgi:DNA-binding XRE family transcriptional regulator
MERKIRPTHPGEMLREDFLPDYGLTASSLALALGVSRQSINELLRKRPGPPLTDQVAPARLHPRPSDEDPRKRASHVVYRSTRSSPTRRVTF